MGERMSDCGLRPYPTYIQAEKCTCRCSYRGGGEALHKPSALIHLTPVPKLHHQYAQGLVLNAGNEAQVAHAPPP